MPVNFIPDKTKSSKVNFIPNEETKPKINFIPDEQIETKSSINFIPDAEATETNFVKEESDKFSLSGAAEQFATGAVNEALLGFPKYMIDKSSPDGQSIWKEMESENKAERIARGMGTFAGFMAGLPGKVFKAGSKLFLGSKPIQKGLNMLVSSKKARRLVQAAGAGASSFGLYEILKAPEEDFGEKVKTVPLNMLIGGVLGVAGQAIKSSLIKKNYKNFAISGDRDLIGIAERERGADLLNNNLMTSGETRLSRMGESGVELEARIKDVMQKGNFKHAKVMEDFGFVNKIKKLNSKELSNITNTLEGRTVSMNDKTDDMIKFFRGFEQASLKEAQGLGIKTKGAMDEKGKRVISDIIGQENYFPHMTINSSTPKSIVNETLDAAVKRGDFKNIGEARATWASYSSFLDGTGREKQFLQYVMKGNKNIKNIEEARTIVNRFMKANKTRRFGNLEFTREVDLPFWDPNSKRVIPKFVKGISNRLEEVRGLGQNNEIANELISKIAESGGNQQTARDIFSLWSDTVDPRDAFHFIGPKMSQNLRNFQVVSKLGLATVANASQSTLTAIKFGVGNTMKAIGQSFTKGGREYARRTGAVLDGALEELMRESTGGVGIGGKFLKATGFSAVERFNRTVAANAGKNYIKNMAQELLKNPSNAKARRAFLEMRISPDRVLKNGTLLLEDLLKAGDSAVKKTQFKGGALDLPLFFNSPEGKITTQFKSFAFNHTKFIKEAILEEAAHGNYEPIIRAVALMPVIGEGVADVRAILTGRKRDKAGLERLAENVSAVGGLGLMTDMWQSAKYKNLAGFAVGPTFSTMAAFGEGAVKAVEGNPNPLAKTTLKQVPVVGPALKNAFQRN